MPIPADRSAQIRVPCQDLMRHRWTTLPTSYNREGKISCSTLHVLSIELTFSMPPEWTRSSFKAKLAPFSCRSTSRTLRT